MSVAIRCTATHLIENLIPAKICAGTMLSAIAARKAARAANATVQSPAPYCAPATTPGDDEDVSDDELLLESTHTVKTPRSKSKRKSPDVVERENSAIKKKKVAHTNTRRKRYFDSPVEVVVEAKEKESEELGSKESEGESSSDAGVEDVSATSPSQQRIDSRAWSPSQPFRDGLDSSNELVNDENAPSWETFGGGHIHSAKDNGQHVRTLLSSFLPQPGVNIFYLDEEDIGRITGKNEVASKGTIIALHGEETVALLGTYKLNVICGVLSMHGSVLFPDPQVSHHVFALKCSPIPPLRAMATSGHSNIENRSFLPKDVLQVIDDDSVVILIRPLVSGIEGLGRICSTFYNSFNIDGVGSDCLGVSTAHLVCFPLALPSKTANSKGR